MVLGVDYFVEDIIITDKSSVSRRVKFHFFTQYKPLDICYFTKTLIDQSGQSRKENKWA